ncbi:hypothetical protein DPMN_117273 [Dreissena polymorpha]|uniref:Uncharacterized protein n=1 Tax=Dreissena polymorpha TaxID=45954 RepID=A0A9D4KPK8_DREPO|nr:hypothetical protein DPMN_117273 [Dreissena polymorpha]
MQGSLWRQLRSKTVILRSVSAWSFKVSLPHSSIENTRDFKGMHLAGKLVGLLVNNLLGLAITAVATKILCRTSAVAGHFFQLLTVHGDF